MVASDPAERRALGQQAIHIRWGNTAAAAIAGREARALRMAKLINRAVNDPPGLTTDQRLELARLLTGGPDA